jgi:alpha-ribazole phosphatase
MEIYLVRHTTPAISKGVCYGQSDIDVGDSFLEEANEIKNLLPLIVDRLYSSPLKRCSKLANFLFPRDEIEYSDDLKEIDCGDWELKCWDEIDHEQLSTWMKDFVNVCFPSGENFFQLAERAEKIIRTIVRPNTGSAVIVTHAGIIRAILSIITDTPLNKAFDTFRLPYGSITMLRKSDRGFSFENIK